MELSCIQAAKLVLGYLKTENCMKAHHEFLRSCRHLKDVNNKPGKYIATRILGLNLIDILSDYAKIYTIVQERLEDTDFFSDRNHSNKLVHQLLFLLDNKVPSRCSTPTFMSRCSTPYRNARLDLSPVHIQPSPEINTTSLKSLPGNADRRPASPKNKVPLSSESPSNSDSESDNPDENGEKNKESTQLAIQAFAQSLLDQHELQEKIADNINKVRCTDAKEKVKGGTACDDIDSAIKAVLDKTESDPAFDTLMGEIIGSVQNHPENNNFQEPHPINDENLIPSRFDVMPSLKEENTTLFFPPTQPTTTNNEHLPQSRPTGTKTDSYKNLTLNTNSGDIILYEGSLESYIKNGANGPAGKTLSSGLSAIDGKQQAGQKSKQKGTQLYLVANQPFNLIPQAPTKINLTEQDILTMPTVIVCDENTKNKPKIAPKKGPVVKPEKKLKTLQPKTSALSEYITLYKCGDEDIKPAEVKTVKTILPKKKAPAKDPISIEVQVLDEKLNKDYGCAKVPKCYPPQNNVKQTHSNPTTSYATQAQINQLPVASNFTPEVQNNQCSSTPSYEPQKNHLSETNFMPDLSAQPQSNPSANSTNFLRNLLITGATTNHQAENMLLPATKNCNELESNIRLSAPNSNHDQKHMPTMSSSCEVQNNLFVSTSSGNQALAIDNNVNQVESLFSSNTQVHPVNNAHHMQGNFLTLSDNVNNIPNVKSSSGSLPEIHTSSQVQKSQGPAQNQFLRIENNQIISNPQDSQLSQKFQSVQNQSNLLQSIQNQNELIQAAQNDKAQSAYEQPIGFPEIVNNDLPDGLKPVNANKVNNRKVTITDVIDVHKLIEEKNTENEMKKKEITPGNKVENRKSSSTPRSGNKSHVRALDFKFHTPAKDIVEVKSLSSSPAKKKSPAKAKTAKSLFKSPPGTNPIIKKKELIKPKTATSWDADLRAVTCADPAVKSKAPPKSRPRKQPAKPKAEPKTKKKNTQAAAGKKNSKSDESNSNDKSVEKEESNRPSKRTRSKSVKSPQKVITVTTDPHNKECVSIVESEGKVEDLLKSNEAKAAINSENQTHSQISLIKCNAKPRYNKKCNIDNPTRKDIPNLIPVVKVDAEEVKPQTDQTEKRGVSPSKLSSSKKSLELEGNVLINENSTSNSVDSKFITPEVIHPRCSEMPTVKKNIMPMLETPVKDFCPKTPRACSPTTVEDTPFTKVFKDQFNDIDLTTIQTPKFLNTPSFPFTPFLDGKSPPSNRGTDYSTSSSYYQPSDTEQNKCLEIYIREECNRTKKRITPIKVDEAMDIEVSEINSPIHVTEKEQLELVCTKTVETTHKAIAEKMKSLSNNVIARKNLSLVNRKNDSSDDSSSEETDTTESTNSSATSSSEDDTIIKNKSMENSLTTYSLRTSKTNSSKDLSDPPEEDIKAILNVSEYKSILPEVNDNNEEDNKRSQLLAEMEIKRKRTIEIFKNKTGNPTKGAATKPPPRKRAPPKPRKSPVKNPPTKQPVKRNLRSNTKTKTSPVISTKQRLGNLMGLDLTSSDDDELQPLQVVETEMVSSSKSNTPVPEIKEPNTKPLASFEKTLKDLSNNKDEPSQKTDKNNQISEPMKVVDLHEVRKIVKNKTTDDGASTPASDKEAQILVEGLKERGIYLVHKKPNKKNPTSSTVQSKTETCKKIEDVAESKVKADEPKPKGNEKSDKKLISSSELKTKTKLNSSKDVEDGEIISDDNEQKSPVEKRKKLNPAPKIPERSKGKHRSDSKTKSAERNKSNERSKAPNPLTKPEDKVVTIDITENVKSEETNQSKSVPQEKKIEETKKSEQSRRKSIQLERKIEQLKHKKSEQTKKSPDDLIKHPSEDKLNRETSPKYSELDIAKKSQSKKNTDTSEALKKSTHIKKTSEMKKKPLEEKKTLDVVDSSKKSEVIDMNPTEEVYYPVDTSLGEHLEFDFDFVTDFIQYTYNEDEEHRIITWNKNFLLKKRSVDIFVDALGKNITRPIGVESNDNIFCYKPPQKRRTSIHIIEDVKIQPKKKPLRALYNDLVGDEPHVNLSTKSPLDELYTNENKNYNQKMTKQLQNDKIQSNKIMKKPAASVVKRTNVERVEKVETVQKDVVIKESEPSTTNIDYLKQSAYNPVPSTPDHSEYDSLMDFSLVLSGTKRKAESEQEKGAKKSKPDNCKEILRKVNVDEFLNYIHKPK